MNLTDSYTAEDIERWFGKHETVAGEGCLNAVSALDIQAENIIADVQEATPPPYRVSIRFYVDNFKELRVDSRCTCPDASRCKHGAAALLAVLAQRAPGAPANSEVVTWIGEMLRSLGGAPKTRAQAPKSPTQLFYVLEWNGVQPDCRLSFLKGRADADGRPSMQAEGWNGTERALTKPPSFVTEEDVAILRMIWSQRPVGALTKSLPVAGKHSHDILNRMVSSGRLLADKRILRVIHAGEPRPGHLEWKVDAHGKLRAHIDVAPKAALILPVEPLWYIDIDRGQAGTVAFDVPPALIRYLLALPPLAEHDMQLVAAMLRDVAPDLPRPSGEVGAGLRIVEAPMTAVLQLDTLAIYGLSHYRDYGYHYGGRDFDYAMPVFQYDELRFPAGDTRAYVVLDSGETVRVRRDTQREAALLQTLEKHGLQKVPAHAVHAYDKLPPVFYGLANESAWGEFMTVNVPQLEAEGWKVEFSPDFRHFTLEVESWQADVAENEPGWFDLDMGVVVEGKRLPLVPLLADLFKRDPRWLIAAQLALIDDDEPIRLHMPEGSRIRVAAERLKPIVRTLIDLFDRPSGGGLRVSRYDALRLEELGDERWQFRGMEQVRELAERLRGMGRAEPVAPPPGFTLILRHYQEEGLAWLQYLRRFDLAGILADDMGLGKTAQTLAHILMEKQAGRLDKPALIVLPTSLIFNWKREAARCAPDLTVLALHGKERRALFAQIAQHDMVLTTYPLLWRDGEELSRHEYHLLILDEAQSVKNARSQGAIVVRKLNARHRLCLTGTPMENHLGELWSQFDFLLPGLLGSSKDFTRTWRSPIEKHGDRLRGELLAKRLKPFVLRRRKEDVAKELPPKTIIVRTVELEGGQRDLYETVRSAMDEKIRLEIAGKGFRRSQIVILDALLKLRQVCCDPRLVKGESAKTVRERAKLTLLMEMLVELVDEGRRILVFSQFTSMLALIVQELERANQPYVILTGDTEDRETPIRRFQAGEVPIFLISLKAGGIGINLTAADTVIHYDPWWNPAVENQATDRAHRIGQDKPVFVYKLIVAGSIEERIVALQDKKAELAESILSEDRVGEVKFSEADIQALLAPLPK
ncbi:MAG: DEAD/DEAH box helicase [Sulfuricellaceae bacterium]